MQEKFIGSAIEAGRGAGSYRDFLVGCAMLVQRADGKRKIFTGANWKPTKNGPKLCAERAAWRAALANGFTKLLAVCVSGEPQPDTHSGIVTCTLHPCKGCRQMLERICGGDTVVLTVRKSSPWVVEKHTLGELLELHNGHRVCRA